MCLKESALKKHKSREISHRNAQIISEKLLTAKQTIIPSTVGKTAARSVNLALAVSFFTVIRVVAHGK